MAGVKHSKVSGVADDGNSTFVQPSDWNAAHTTDVTPGTLLKADTGGVIAASRFTEDASGNAYVNGVKIGSASGVGAAAVDVRFTGTNINRAKSVLLRSVLKSVQTMGATTVWNPGASYTGLFFLRDWYMAALPLPGYFNSAKLNPALTPFFTSIGGDGIGPAQAAQHFVISGPTASYREGTNNLGYRPTYDTAAYMVLMTGLVYRRGDKTIYATRKAALKAMFEETPRASSGLLYSNPSEQNCGWGFESGNNVWGELGMASALYAQAAREMVYMATDQGDEPTAAIWRTHFNTLTDGLRTLRRSDGLYPPGSLATGVRHAILSALMVSEGLILDPEEREQTARALRDGVLKGQVVAVSGAMRHLFMDDYFPGAANAPGVSQNGKFWPGHWTGWLAGAMALAGDTALGTRILQSAADSLYTIHTGSADAPWEYQNLDGTTGGGTVHSMAGGSAMWAVDDVASAGSYKLVNQSGGLTLLHPDGYVIDSGSVSVVYLAEQNYSGMSGTVVLRGPDGTTITSLATSAPVIVQDVAAQNVAITDILTAQTASGGGSPGGNDTEFQYKSGTAFAATPNVRWDAANGTLLVGPGATSTNAAGGAVLSATSNDTTSFWAGRILAGGSQGNANGVTFLMGQANIGGGVFEAWLGGHNAALSAWAALRINPDGPEALHLGAMSSSRGNGPIVTVDNTTNTTTVNGPLTANGAVTVPNASFGVAKLSATGTPSATTYLRGDNTWATPTAAATPGGSSGQVQYNNAGALGGTANVEVSAAGHLNLVAASTPATPAAGRGTLYGKQRAGRVIPTVISPDGVQGTLQEALFSNSVQIMLPNTGTTVPTAFGNVWTGRASTGTLAHPSPASTNGYTATRRMTGTTGTVAAQGYGIQGSFAMNYLGNAANRGGFFFFCRFGWDTLNSGSRLFIGLTTQNAAYGATEPSTVNNSVGLVKDSTDTNASFLMRGTAATKNGTFTPAANTIYDFTMSCPPNSTTVTYRLVDETNGTTIFDNLSTSTNAPAVNTFMYPWWWVGTSTTSTVVLGVCRLYVASDF